MNLVLLERKSINTFTYVMLIIMAYFGPNAEILGNVKLKIWQFQRPIPDIYACILKVSLLMAVDLLTLVINGLLIWKICCINIFHILKNLQKEYWMYFAVAEAYVLMEVKCNVDLKDRYLIEFLFLTTLALCDPDNWCRE